MFTIFTSVLLIFVTFIGFPDTEAVMCTYEVNENNVYSCNLINQTILTESDMDTETGTHLPGFSNDNVTLLISDGHTVIEFFPSTLINEFNNLQSVILMDVGMKGFTNSLGSCRTLSFVALLFNEISSVPRNIFSNCDQLTNLYISYNRINFIDVAALSGLTKLRHLALTDNAISFLDPLVFEPTRNLEILSLDSNSIREVSPQTFELMPLLTSLTLTGNNITTWNSTFLENNQALQQLHLDRNEISSVSGDTFSNLPNLRVLRVGDFIDELPVFNGLNSLEELRLNDNKLKYVSVDSFRNLNKLRRLDLSFNNIESVNFTLASAELLPNLDYLSLTSNNISEIPDGTFSNLSNLTDLSLRRNRIEILTAESIRPIAQIRRLDVSFNQITRIEKEFFSDVTNLTLLSSGNVCFNDELTIESRDDFENRAATLLEPCFNFASTMTTNIFLFVGLAIFACKSRY